MDARDPVTVICRYVVEPGREGEFEGLLARHWPALREAGLVTEAPARVYRGLPSDAPGEQHGAARTYVELFEWKDAAAPEVAHQTPSIMALWEPMGMVCESMEFPHYQPLAS